MRLVQSYLDASEPFRGAPRSVDNEDKDEPNAQQRSAEEQVETSWQTENTSSGAKDMTTEGITHSSPFKEDK